MKINVAECAQALRVYDVWRPGNPTGVVTDPNKYFRVGAQPYDRFVRHVTVGTDSLGWLAGTNTVACIPYLIPTARSDRDPSGWGVYKLIPDDARGYHVGDMEWRGEQEAYWHARTMGHEIENLGDFKHEIETRQYIKSALIYAYDCARWRWQDYMVFDHSTIAVPHTNQGGRRTDPQAGLFRESLWWDIIQQVREEWPWQSPAVWWGGRNE